jgi:hypothetical protein
MGSRASELLEDDTEMHLKGADGVLVVRLRGVNVAHALTDAGVESQHHHWMVLDEVWRSLRAGLVDNTDASRGLIATRASGRR